MSLILDILSTKDDTYFFPMCQIAGQPCSKKSIPFINNKKQQRRYRCQVKRQTVLKQTTELITTNKFL